MNCFNTLTPEAQAAMKEIQRQLKEHEEAKSKYYGFAFSKGVPESPDKPGIRFEWTPYENHETSHNSAQDSSTTPTTLISLSGFPSPTGNSKEPEQSTEVNDAAK